MKMTKIEELFSFLELKKEFRIKFTKSRNIPEYLNRFVTVSISGYPTSEFKKCIKEIKENGFLIRDDKIKYSRKYKTSYVTTEVPKEFWPEEILHPDIEIPTEEIHFSGMSDQKFLLCMLKELNIDHDYYKGDVFYYKTEGYGHQDHEDVEEFLRRFGCIVGPKKPWSVGTKSETCIAQASNFCLRSKLNKFNRDILSDKGE